MEFAFIAPVLVMMLLGVYELCNMALIYEELQNAAHSIPASASNLAVQGANGATYLTYQQIQLTESEIWSEIPELRTGFQDGTKSVTISSVTFIPTLPPAPPNSQVVKPAQSCTPSKTPAVTCNYTPTVVWSVAYDGGNSGRTFVTSQTSGGYRSCTGAPTVGSQANATVAYPATGTVISYQTVTGGLNSEVPPTYTGTNAGNIPSWTASDLTSLPTLGVANPDPNLAPPSPILVVDVHLKYMPIFGLFYKSGINFYGTGFYPVRSVQTSIVSGGTTTQLTLSQQFTTIQASSLSSAPGGSFCYNNSIYLYPAAES